MSPTAASDPVPSDPSSPRSAAPDVTPPGTALLLGLSAGLGVLATLAAYAFLVLVHEAEHLVWVVVPGWWGATEPPAWWVVVVLAAGAVAVYGATRLAGRGGHHPLDGLSFDTGPRT
ncbi:MAG TPA: hypothetical protein VN257_06260, partial [Actinotalea sp.]|nr:hypothetical protein [Actinotalea sp.]